MTAPPAIRALFALGLSTMALGSSEAFVAGCRREAPGSTGEGTGAGAAAPPAGGARAERSAGDATAAGEREDAAGRAARSVEARAGEARHDAGDVDPACDGAELSLLAAAVDPRCAVSERERSALARPSEDERDGGGRAGGSAAPGRPGALRQEARREADGSIVVSIVNGGAAPVIVPLRFHPGRPELAFSVLAESGEKAVFELAPPSNDAPTDTPRTSAAAAPSHGSIVLPDLDAGSSFARVHSARIRLAPGGAARARLAIDPRIVKRLDRRCGEAGSSGTTAASGSSEAGAGSSGACRPPRLAKGPVVLYIGQVVAAIDAGPPARIAWDVP